MWVDACRVQLRATPNTVNNARPEGITGGALSVAVPRLAPRDPGTAVTPLPGTGNAVSPLGPDGEQHQRRHDIDTLWGYKTAV